MTYYKVLEQDLTAFAVNSIPMQYEIGKANFGKNSVHFCNYAAGVLAYCENVKSPRFFEIEPIGKLQGDNNGYFDTECSADGLVLKKEFPRAEFIEIVLNELRQNKEMHRTEHLCMKFAKNNDFPISGFSNIKFDKVVLLLNGLQQIPEYFFENTSVDYWGSISLNSKCKIHQNAFKNPGFGNVTVFVGNKEYIIPQGNTR